jgi:hypothetical protein
VYNLTAGRVKQTNFKMKKSLFTAFVVGLGLTMSVMAQVPSYVPTNGLVGWWPFNGNANDESGNGNNGTVNGATLTNDRFGQTNKAYDFNGTNNKITIPHSNSLQLNNGATFSLWARIDTMNFDAGSGDFDARLIDKSTPGGVDGYLIDFNHRTTSPNPAYFNLCSQGSSRLRTIIGGSVILTDCLNPYSNWSHLIITFNNGILKSYINGALSESILTSSSTIQQNFNALVFGYQTSGNANTWLNGQLDDIGIWNRALTECEISDLYNAQLGSFSNTTVSINPTLSAIGSNATLAVSTTVQNLQWQSNPGNMGWNNVVNNNTYSGSDNDTLVVSNLQLSNHNQPFGVLACGHTSNIATIQIADTCITNVTVYDTLLTSVTDTLIINTTLSLPAPNNENTILIYPNPASDHITIDNGNFAAMTGYSIKITNNAGQQVFQSAINQQQFYVDLSTWSGNGLYFVHLIDSQNNTLTVRKIVLQ